MKRFLSQSMQSFTSDDLLSKVALKRMLVGVSTRHYGRTQVPVGDEVEIISRSTSKSAISRRFDKLTREALDQLMSRTLDEIELAAPMIDGIEFKRTPARGCHRHHNRRQEGSFGPLEGSTENAQDADSLLADLQDRGRSFKMRMRCKERNVLERRVGGDAHGDTPWCYRGSQGDYAVHQPNRVDDLNGAGYAEERQALERRLHVDEMDCSRHARGLRRASGV